jgi:hypothetical protein
MFGAHRMGRFASRCLTAALFYLLSACLVPPARLGKSVSADGGPAADLGAPVGADAGLAPPADAAYRDAAATSDAGQAGEDASLEPPLVDDDAAIVSAELPNALRCGAVFAARVTVRNTGAHRWTRAEGYKLGIVDDSDPLYRSGVRVWLSDDVVVEPGATYTFEFELHAPDEAGTYETDWRMVHEAVQWFGEAVVQRVAVNCEPPVGRSGPVRLNGTTVVDDHGAFNALGATLMWGAWAYRHDRPMLERNLAALARHGFHYIRCLGVVGDPQRQDYWDGREIEWRWHDYAEVIAGLTDLAYNRYGLRVQWTLIGDGDASISDEQDRYRLADTFLSMSRGRESAIMHFEIANEAWQNGFAGDRGLAQLRALSAYMKERTNILVAASAPQQHECEAQQRMYRDDIADLATIHFDRNQNLADGPWRPVRQPWHHQFCNGLPTASNNEPVGPGSSVSTENDSTRLVAAAVVTWISRLPMYVYHSGAGVRGDHEIRNLPSVSAFAHLADVLPAGLSGWEARNAHWDNSPFVVYAGDSDGNLHADTMWPDFHNPTSGAVRAYASVHGNQFISLPMGIHHHVVMAARRAVEFEEIDLLTGAVRRRHSLQAGERFTLSGRSAVLLKGHFR